MRRHPELARAWWLMQKSPHPCPTATEDASRAVRACAHAVGGAGTARNPFGRWHLRGTRTQGESRINITRASARRAYFGDGGTM